MKIKLSKRDLRTVAHIIGSKANEMHKKGANWMQGERYLSCVQMGKIANKILKSVSPNEKFVFKWDKIKDKIQK